MYYMLCTHLSENGEYYLVLSFDGINISIYRISFTFILNNNRFTDSTLNAKVLYRYYKFNEYDNFNKGFDDANINA